MGSEIEFAFNYEIPVHSVPNVIGVPGELYAILTGQNQVQILLVKRKVHSKTANGIETSLDVQAYNKLPTDQPFDPTRPYYTTDTSGVVTYFPYNDVQGTYVKNITVDELSSVFPHGSFINTISSDMVEEGPSIEQVITSVNNQLQESTQNPTTKEKRKPGRPKKITIDIPQIDPSNDKDVNVIASEYGLMDEVLIRHIDNASKSIPSVNADLLPLLQYKYGDSIVTIEKDTAKSEVTTIYCWNDKTKLWKKHHTSMLMKFIVDDVRPHVEGYKIMVSLQLRNMVASFEGPAEALKEDPDYKYLHFKNATLKCLAEKLGTTSFLKDVIKQYVCRILDEDFMEKLDSDIFSLPIKGGLLLNLKTKEVRRRVKTDYFTDELKLGYDPHCSSAKLTQMLNAYMSQNQTLINHLQIILGTCLTGSISYRKLIIFYGPGAKNAKSTLMTLVCMVLGSKYAITMTPNALQQMKNTNPSAPTPDLAMLKGCRLAIRNEGSKYITIDNDMIKQFTGGNRLTARFLNENYFTFSPTFTPIMLCNTLPSCDMTDPAMKDRVEIITFKCRFGSAKELAEGKCTHLADPQFQENISKDEQVLSALFTWMVEGCYRFFNNDYEVPDEVCDAKEVYVKEQDEYTPFIEEMLILPTPEELALIPGVNGDSNGLALENGTYIAGKELYDIYVNWCLSNGQKKQGGPAFGSAMKKDHLQYRLLSSKAVRYICKLAPEEIVTANIN